MGATLTRPDIESVEECLKRHERLVYHVIKKLFGPQHVFDEDLVQIGRIALWKAAQSFEPEKGGKFSTHAGKAIWNEFTNTKRKARYQKRTLDEGTEVIHLDQILESGESGVELTYHDLVTNNEGFDENVVNRVTVETLIRRLPVSERQVIIWRFGLDGKEPRTLKEIARHYGFSLERARQIVERALHRLREAV